MAIKADVIVIGGGSTGTGIARDLALRGLKPLLLEKNDFASGATGACQGLLHSGGRYVVSDLQSARECYGENKILRKIATNCVEKTGGLFVSLPEDGLEYQKQFITACEGAGIPTEVLPPEKALACEPGLSPEVIGAVKVPDASINPFTLVAENAKAAVERGAVIMLHTRTTGLIVEGGRIKGIRAFNQRKGESFEAHSEFVINATGSWAHQLVQTIGLSIPLAYSKGSILITSRRPTEMVINRCRPPADGDIIVPNETTGLIGTTSIPVRDLENLTIERHEVNLLVGETERMVPSIGSARLIRAYAGVRPLFSQTGFENDRQVSRGFILLDHEERDGIQGLISIVGGKMATYRLMAERTVDLVCQKLGVARGCTTHTEPLPASRKERFIGMKERLKRTVPENRKDERDQIICECELVTRREIEEAVMVTGDGDLNGIRVLTRMGTGPCQGTLCAYKTLGILAEMDRLSGSSSNRILKDFLERRWRGIRPIVQNDQLREEELTAAIYGGVFNLDKEDLSLNKTIGEQEDPEKSETSK